MNPVHILAILSVISGWHIDHVDAELMERNQHKLRQLNIRTDEPVIIDSDKVRSLLKDFVAYYEAARF